MIERIRARVHGCWRRFAAHDKLDAIRESNERIFNMQTLILDELEKQHMSIDDIQTAEATEHDEIGKLRTTVNKAVDALTHAQGETTNPELKAKIDAVLAEIHSDTEDIKSLNATTTAVASGGTVQPAQSNNVVGNPGTGNAEVPADAQDAAKQAQDQAEQQPAQASTATGVPSSQDANSTTAVGNVGNSTTLGEAA